MIIVANLLAGAGYYFLFNYIKTQTESVSILTNKVNLGQKRNSRLNDLRTAVKDTEGERQQLSSLLLANGSEVDFIEKIESLAKKSNLTENTSNVSQVAGSVAGTKILQLSIGISGSWSDVMYFLNQLENLPYEIHIPSVSLSEQGGSASSNSKLKPSNIWSGGLSLNVIESM